MHAIAYPVQIACVLSAVVAWMLVVPLLDLLDTAASDES
jgi:hypothetical protein